MPLKHYAVFKFTGDSPFSGRCEDTHLRFIKITVKVRLSKEETGTV